MTSIGGNSNPEGDDPTDEAAQARSESHRKIDDVAARRETAQRERFVELVRGHPAMLLDDASAGESSTPPNPASNIGEGKNSAVTVGGDDDGSSRVETAAGQESKG